MPPIRNRPTTASGGVVSIFKVGLVIVSLFCFLVMLFAEEEREVLHHMLKTTEQEQEQETIVIHDNIIDISAEQVWKDLLQEGAALKQSPGIVMEVGMHRAIQCMNAAKAGFQTHCVEPSPNSFQRVQGAVVRAPPDVQKRIHLYQVAAGSNSDGTVPFTSSGGTGDHVGEHDMWAMADQQQQQQQNDANSQIIQVPTMKLDDIALLHPQTFLLKVDTQGFEPTVFSGLKESLQQHKIQYILTEFWPRGMDLLAGKPNHCIGTQLLQQLVQAGYTLYAMPVAAHPKAPRGWQSLAAQRPLHNLRDFCEWYFQLEHAFPSKDYRMGYWSDILAVAPGVQVVLSSTQTKTGKALAGLL